MLYMVKKSRVERGRTLPLTPEDLAWWSKSAWAALGKRTQKELAQYTGRSESAISRLLNGETPNIDLLIVVSDYLGIAPPVFICRSEREAAELARQRRFVVPDEELREIVQSAMRNMRNETAKKKAG